MPTNKEGFGILPSIAKISAVEYSIEALPDKIEFCELFLERLHGVGPFRTLDDLCRKELHPRIALRLRIEHLKAYWACGLYPRLELGELARGRASLSDNWKDALADYILSPLMENRLAEEVMQEISPLKTRFYASEGAEGGSEWKQILGRLGPFASRHEYAKRVVTNVTRQLFPEHKQKQFYRDRFRFPWEDKPEPTEIKAVHYKPWGLSPDICCKKGPV